MKKFRKLTLVIPFCVGLITPIALPAASASPTQDRDDHARDDHSRGDKAHQGYYDQDHKDYHQWNSDEQRYWRQYWSTEHRPYVDWDRASEEQRRAYWRWRHEHSEHHDRDHDRDDRR